MRGAVSSRCARDASAFAAVGVAAVAVALAAASGCGRVGFDDVGSSGLLGDAAVSMDAQDAPRDAEVVPVDGRGPDDAVVDTDAGGSSMDGGDVTGADSGVSDSGTVRLDGGAVVSCPSAATGDPCATPGETCTTAGGCCHCVASGGCDVWECATPSLNPPMCPPRAPTLSTCDAFFKTCEYCTAGVAERWSCGSVRWMREPPPACM